MTAKLEEWYEKVVSVITNDGRHLLGVLKGHDQETNVVLDECRERMYAPDAPVEEEPLGLNIIRGDNIATIGLLDEELDAKQNLTVIRCEPLKAVAR